MCIRDRICGGIAKATNTEAALFNGGGIRIDDQLEGAIQAIDVFRVLPFKGNVTETALSGVLLLKVLEHGLVKQVGKGSYLQTYNLTYDSENNTGEIGGKPIVPSQTYRIGFGAYLLNSLMKKGKDNEPSIIPRKEFDIGIDLRVAVINYLETLSNK